MFVLDLKRPPGVLVYKLNDIVVQVSLDRCYQWLVHYFVLRLVNDGYRCVHHYRHHKYPIVAVIGHSCNIPMELVDFVAAIGKSK